jgi:hypothetical protein
MVTPMWWPGRSSSTGGEEMSRGHHEHKRGVAYSFYSTGLTGQSWRQWPLRCQRGWWHRSAPTAGGVEDLHGKVEREVMLGEAMRNGLERDGREPDGVTMHGNKGGTGRSSQWGKMGPKGLAGFKRGSRRRGGAQ